MKRQKIKYFSGEEKKSLLSALQDRKSAERDYMMFNLVFNTGLRVSELVSLNVAHVKEVKSLDIIGKGNKHREVPLNKHIREHIQRYLKVKRKRKELLHDDAPLFVSRKNNRISVRAVQRSMAKWCKEAGLKRSYSPHALRHTFGTEIQRKCKNLRVTQDLLGHANIATTQIYTHVTKEELQEAVERLEY